MHIRLQRDLREGQSSVCKHALMMVQLMFCICFGKVGFVSVISQARVELDEELQSLCRLCLCAGQDC